MKAETYYAIRIGDPRRNFPYLKVQPGTMTPLLFVTKELAQLELSREPGPARKVVRVKIRPG